MRVELRNIGKSCALPLGFVTVLHGIDLVLGDGEHCLVTGPSGSGKTTLLNVIGGLARPTSGTVHLDGHVMREPVPGVSSVFQEPVFIPELTVLENLMAPSVCNRERHALAQGERLLEQFGLADVFDIFPALLSRGEQRRLALARSLLSTPSLLLLDEPLAFLDEAWQEKVMELVLETVHETGATLVIATAGTVPGAEYFRQVRLIKGKVISDGGNNH
jgi:ABC-type nitrate/sulfonate/bicarbonate transport system ATPase subunit